MRSFVGSIIITFFYATVTGYCQNDELIPYSDKRKLKFEDFQLPYDSSLKYSGWTAIQIKLKVLPSTDTIKLNIICEFEKKKSYIEKNNMRLLNHEQLHFDLKELWTRKFRKKLISEKFFLVSTEDSIIKLFNTYHDSSEAEGDLYDKESEHSLNEFMQKSWDSEILNQLNSLSFFQMTELVFLRKGDFYFCLSYK